MEILKPNFGSKQLLPENDNCEGKKIDPVRAAGGGCDFDFEVFDFKNVVVHGHLPAPMFRKETCKGNRMLWWTLS